MKAIDLGEFTVGVVTNPKGGYDVCFYHDGNQTSVQYGLSMTELCYILAGDIMCVEESYEEE